MLRSSEEWALKRHLSMGKHTARAMEDALEDQEGGPGEVSEEDAL
jgi:hypothetical protein